MIALTGGRDQMTIKIEITPSQAARILGVTPETVLRWAKESVSGGQSQLSGVRVDHTRRAVRYFIDADEVRSLAMQRDVRDFF